MLKSIVKFVLPAPFRLYLKEVVYDIKLYSRYFVNFKLKKSSSLIVTEKDYLVYGSPNTDTFFGYYDITPFRNQYVLYLQKKSNSKTIDIVLDSLTGDEKKVIGATNAWNWQQGCRLRWFPVMENVISYNICENGEYKNRIYNIDKKEDFVINWPLYDISHDGSMGVTLDFERLGILRPGYGYTCNGKNLQELGQPFIELIDLRNNYSIHKLCGEEISRLVPGSAKADEHYINHLSFSPDGKKFLFFWIDIFGEYHKASLLVYDIVEGTTIPLETDLKVSHYVWENSENIICTAYDVSYNCVYYRYNILSKSKEVITNEVLNCDGHPSMCNLDTILTDTYPDVNWFQHLRFVNITNNEHEELMSIFSIPIVRGERRTDLHPRFNEDKSLVSIDANVEGNRNMYVIKLK